MSFLDNIFPAASHNGAILPVYFRKCDQLNLIHYGSRKVKRSLALRLEPEPEPEQFVPIAE